MSEELEVLKLVTSRLEAAGIVYMVSGSTAMNYYAQPRMTRDIDIVVALGITDAERLAALFAADFYCDPETVRDAITDQGVFNLIHTQSIIKVDLIVRKDSPYRRAELARRLPVRIDDATIWLVTAEDLILSKLFWAKDSRSEMQLGDVRNLIASVPDLDWLYIERWARELTVTDLLDETRS